MQLFSLCFPPFLGGALFYAKLTHFHALESSKESKQSSLAEVSARVFSSQYLHLVANAMQHFLPQKKQGTATLQRPILKS